MNDLYETRKQKTGSFVKRKHTPEGMPDSGYVMYRHLLPNDLSSQLTTARDVPNVSLLVKEPETQDIRSALRVHELSPFREVCDAIQPIAEQILNGPAYVHQSRINFKRAKQGSGWSWHSDFETWHAQDGMPLPLAVTAMIPLEENCSDNGPLLIIPNSHKWYWSAPIGEEHSPVENFAYQKDGVPTDEVITELKRLCNGEEVQVLADVGDVLFFDCNLMHGSKNNTSDRSRTNFYIVFNRIDNELVEPFSASIRRPIEMGFRK